MLESYCSCLIFLFTGILNKILAPSRASGNTRFTTCLQSAHVKVLKKTKCYVKENNFKVLLQ